MTAEYAKNSPDDILIKITISNRGSEAATIHVLPTLWFRNTWIWGCKHEGCTMKAKISQDGEGRVRTKHDVLQEFVCDFEGSTKGKAPVLLFTENETNSEVSICIIFKHQYVSYDVPD